MGTQIWRKPSGRGSIVTVEEDGTDFDVWETSDGLARRIFTFDEREPALACARDYAADRLLSIRATNIVR